MGQFSVKIYLPTGSVLNGNQHTEVWFDTQSFNAPLTKGHLEHHDAD